MSHSHSTKVLLDLKDKHIIIDDKLTEKKQYRQRLTNFIYGKLTYTPTHCPLCGGLDEAYSIVKNGMKESRIKWLPMANYPTILVLKKQRFLCRQCQQSFMAETPEVMTHCFIANRVKQSIAVEAGDKIAMTDLAKRHFVSTSCVVRVLASLEPTFDNQCLDLPSALCFDEFKSVKQVEGAMSFIYMNADTREIIDILPDRRLFALRRHFSRYSLAARNKVNTVVIDMNAPYFILIQELFPNAKVVIDPFHLVQLMSRALNKTRIRVMAKFNHSKTYKQTDYTKLKHYWKLLLKDRDALNYQNHHYHRLFKKQMVSTEIVDYLLTLDPELRATYTYYQDLLDAYHSRDFDDFDARLTAVPPLVSEEMTTSIRTLKKHKERLRNTFASSYSNGPLEGTINKIKVIKRIAFGFRSFISFRRRILISCQTSQKSSERHHSLTA